MTSPDISLISRNVGPDYRERVKERERARERGGEIKKGKGIEKRLGS